MKILMFDLEHGSQTLGSKQKIQDMFQYPVLEPGTWDQFISVMGKLFVKENYTEDIKIGELTIPEEKQRTVLKNGTEVDAVVIDTFSELSKKYMRTLTDKDGKMKIQNWGQLKNKLDTCLEFVSSIPGIVICNCHSRLKDTDDGTKVLPYIDGSTKEDISKWFDFVFYTKNKTKAGGVNEYVWVTKRSEKYDHAKDRTDMLPAEIPQDYQIVMDAVKKAGFPSAKILVIGSPGSGKTKSLATLTQKTKKENKS